MGKSFFKKIIFTSQKFQFWSLSENDFLEADRFFFTPYTETQSQMN